MRRLLWAFLILVILGAVPVGDMSGTTLSGNTIDKAPILSKGAVLQTVE